MSPCFIEKEQKMTEEAEVSILLYSELRPWEENKLKSIENDVFQALLNSGIKKRSIWKSNSNKGYRFVQLIYTEENNTSILCELSEDELNNFSSSDIINRLKDSLK